MRTPRTMLLTAATIAALLASPGTSIEGELAGQAEATSSSRTSAHSQSDASVPAVHDREPERDAAAPVLRIVGPFNGNAGRRSLQRSDVTVGQHITHVDGQPATLAAWQSALREIGRAHWEENGGDSSVRQHLTVTLDDGRTVDLDVLGRAKVRQPDGTWRYNAFTGAEVLEGWDAPLTPEPEPEPVQPPPPAVPYEELSDGCKRVHDLFGPRPPGAPCWHLAPWEERDLMRARRLETISDPERYLPHRNDWPFSPGIEDVIPPYRIPQGYGYENLPGWVAAGAYSASQWRISCTEGTGQLLGTVYTGPWAIHAYGCVKDGEQTSGALIHAQPDPYDCSAGPLPLTECRNGRLTLLQLAVPSDGLRPDIRGAEKRPSGIVDDLLGADQIHIPVRPGSVPYVASRAIPIG